MLQRRRKNISNNIKNKVIVTHFPLRMQYTRRIKSVVRSLTNKNLDLLSIRDSHIIAKAFRFFISEFVFKIPSIRPSVCPWLTFIILYFYMKGMAQRLSISLVTSQTFQGIVSSRGFLIRFLNPDTSKLSKKITNGVLAQINTIIYIYIYI